MRSRPVFLLVILLSSLAPPGAWAAQSDEFNQRLLPAAAGTEHLWFVTAASGRNDRRFELRHHARSMDGPYLSPPVTISSEPDALAVSGPRVWAVMPAREINGAWQREVFTVEAVLEPAIGMYKIMPENRLGLAPALPGTGALAGFVGTEQGPVALLMPHQHAMLDRNSLSDAAAPDAEPPQPRLLLLRNEQWIDVSLPDALPRRARVRLGAAGGQRDRLAIIAATPGNLSEARLYRQSPDQGWTSSTLELNMRRLISLATVDGQVAAVMRGPADGTGLHVSYVRPSQLVELATLPIPSGRWAVVGWGQSLRLIESSTLGTIHMTPIDGITGVPGTRATMAAQPLPSGRLWYLGTMLAVAVLAVILAIIVRPSAQPEVKLPRGLAPLPVIPRLAALLIDLVPGAALVILVLRTPPVELLRLPLMTESIEQSAPFFIMVVVFLIHTTMSEIFTGRTIGKALMGGYVTTVSGGQPGAVALLIRGVLTMLILLVPPLAVFALFSPYLQGFNDLVARTVVVQRAEASDDAE